jgi:hypothetical protein
VQEENGPGARRPRPIRLSRVVLGLMALFTVGGALYLGASHFVPTFNRDRPACVATRTISAFDRIRPLDVVCGVQITTAQSDVEINRQALENHYTLVEIVADQPITRTEIGPALPDDRRDYAVVSVRGNQSVSLDGRLSRADEVTVVWASDAATGGSSTDGTVLDVRSIDANTWVVTLAVAQPPDRSAASMLMRGDVLVVKRST